MKTGESGSKRHNGKAVRRTTALAVERPGRSGVVTEERRTQAPVDNRGQVGDAGEIWRFRKEADGKRAAADPARRNGLVVVARSGAGRLAWPKSNHREMGAVNGPGANGAEFDRSESVPSDRRRAAPSICFTGAAPVRPLFTFGVSWSTYFAGCRTPSCCNQSGFGVGVRWWSVGAATTEKDGVETLTLPYANAERPRRSPIAPPPPPPPPPPAQPRIVQKSDTPVDIISRIYRNTNH